MLSRTVVNTDKNHRGTQAPNLETEDKGREGTTSSRREGRPKGLNDRTTRDAKRRGRRVKGVKTEPVVEEECTLPVLSQRRGKIISYMQELEKEKTQGVPIKKKRSPARTIVNINSIIRMAKGTVEDRTDKIHGGITIPD